MHFISALLLLTSLSASSVVPTPSQNRALSSGIEVLQHTGRPAVAVKIRDDATQKMSPQLKAVFTYLDALASYSLAAFNATIAPSYTHSFLPASYASSQGWPEAFTRAQSLDLLQFGIWAYVNGLKVVSSKIIEDGNVIAVHAMALDTAKGKYTGHPYAEEYMYIFTVACQKDGTYKMLNVKEYVDSAFALKFWADEYAAAAAAGHPVPPLTF